MSPTRVLLLLASLTCACVAEADDGDGATEGADGTTAGEASAQYRACSANEDCEEPTPFCFAQLGVCMKACAVVETCPEAPPEGSAAPVCALTEYDAQQYQVCLLQCGDADDCPEGMGCAPVPECQDCEGSICQPL